MSDWETVLQWSDGRAITVDQGDAIITYSEVPPEDTIPVAAAGAVVAARDALVVYRATRLAVQGATDDVVEMSVSGKDWDRFEAALDALKEAIR